MLVERRMGMTGGSGMQKEGPYPKGLPLAFGLGPRPLLYSGITMHFYYQKERSCPPKVVACAVYSPHPFVVSTGQAPYQKDLS